MLVQSFQLFLAPRPPLSAVAIEPLRAEIVRYGDLDHIQHLSLGCVHNWVSQGDWGCPDTPHRAYMHYRSIATVVGTGPAGTHKIQTRLIFRIVLHFLLSS